MTAAAVARDDDSAYRTGWKEGVVVEHRADVVAVVGERDAGVDAEDGGRD